MTEQSELIRNLDNPACYDHPTSPVQHLETHISHILLSGEYAYKIKKPLNLGFLDFSTLAQRQFACQEEIRLNRRLAPNIYLDVVPITGSPEEPRINGTGVPFEYAVKMRQFPPDATLDKRIVTGQLSAAHIERVAIAIADFHLHQCAHTGIDSAWGDPHDIWLPVAQNFLQIAPLLPRESDRQKLDSLRDWSEAEHARLTPMMVARKRLGFVRECHGDLHLGNLAWVDDDVLIFDCLEFSPELRWIDIQSEIAFLVMDLMERGHPDWAWLCLNTWLEKTGDYGGLPLLRYYAVYRALVRLKVALLRLGQNAGPEHASGWAEVNTLLNLAITLSRPQSLRLDITHGLSGSGKSTFTQQMMQTPGAIRLRSDVERKRLAGLDALAHSESALGEHLYGADATRRTYSHLAHLAGAVLDAGWPVIVDATFSARWQRDLMRDLASTRGVAFYILDFQVPESVLRERIQLREQAGKDVSEAGLAVLQHQIETEEKIALDEVSTVIPIEAAMLSMAGARDQLSSPAISGQTNDQAR